MAAAAAAEGEPPEVLVEVAEQRGLFAYRLAVVSPVHGFCIPRTAAENMESAPHANQASAASVCPTLGFTSLHCTCCPGNQVYEEARQLFRRHRGLIALGGSEWPNIRCAAGMASRTSALLASLTTMCCVYCVCKQRQQMPCSIHPGLQPAGPGPASWSLPAAACLFDCLVA